MSSKTRIIAFALAFAFMAAFAFSAQADVTGSFTTSIAVEPQTTATEMEPLNFDIENALDLTVVISGLSTTLHSHFGLAGVEDVQLTYAATLGALDINGKFVFGRFAGVCEFPGPALGFNACFDVVGLDNDSNGVVNNTVPVSDDLLFIKKRVKTSISLGGVSFENLALFEDVNFPETLDPVSHQTADQEFAFGDVIMLSGSTPSGVSIEAETGICAQPTPNTIKKHWWPFEVNPDCAPNREEEVGTPANTTTGKPDLMFDFERLTISSIPVASGVKASANILCVQTIDCSMTNTFDFTTTGPIPFTVEFEFIDLFTFDFDGAELTFSTGAGTLTVEVLADGTLGTTEIDLSTTLNPDTNPATLNVNAVMLPGTGILEATIGLDVSRSNVDFGIDAVFAGTGGDTAEFDAVSFSVGTDLGDAISISTAATFGAFGFSSSNTTFTINF